MFSFPVYKFPFLYKTRQVWKFNFYPTIYIAIFNLGLIINMLNVSENLFNNIDLNSNNYMEKDNQEKFDNLTNTDKITYKLY